MILKVRPRPRASAGPKNSLEMHTGDFPGSPVIKNLASTAGDKGLIPDQGKSPIFKSLFLFMCRPAIKIAEIAGQVHTPL